jgi:hypothetical protein
MCGKHTMASIQQQNQDVILLQGPGQAHMTGNLAPDKHQQVILLGKLRQHQRLGPRQQQQQLQTGLPRCRERKQLLLWQLPAPVAWPTQQRKAQLLLAGVYCNSCAARVQGQQPDWSFCMLCTSWLIMKMCTAAEADSTSSRRGKRLPEQHA